MNNEKMMSVPSLSPVSDEEMKELTQYFNQVRDHVVPEIVKEVETRYRNAEAARALFIR